VKDHFKPEYLENKNDDEQEIAALVAASWFGNAKTALADATTAVSQSKWKINRM
jgi:hypothetical protein